MVLETDSLKLLQESLGILEQSFDGMPAFDSAVDLETIRRVLEQTAERMQDNYPYPHPLYAGQMLKPPHPVARLAYMLAMWINPNNHALDGSRTSSPMEKEAVALIAEMFGWGDQYLGHLTSGGTMANLEALWVADRSHPGKTIVASTQAHYTHSRITDVLKIPYLSVEADSRGKMDLVALERILRSDEVGTVVATLGTTGIGSIDPLSEILELKQRYGFRVHVDAAYGGYFKLATNTTEDVQKHFDDINQVDSIVVDPHKCGLQPYGCGCILFRDPGVGAVYKHDSPYTYFSSDALHLGEISLECSRAGASAVALWATMQMLPLEPGGEFARNIEQSREAAIQFHQKVLADTDELAVMAPELDIVIWAPAAKTASAISALTRKTFNDCAANNLHLAVLQLPATLLQQHWPGVEFDRGTVSCLRTCLMKPEHLDWLDRIWDIYKFSRCE